MSGVVMQDPPEPNRGRVRSHEATEWHSLLKPCLKKRTVWFKVREPYETTTAAASAAYDIRNGRNGALPEGRWDATSRGCHLWIRYMGTK